MDSVPASIGQVEYCQLVKSRADAEVRVSKFVVHVRCAFEVARALPEAQLRNGRNVYVAEAQVDATEDWIRPGMEGMAKIELGRRRIWWVTLHRVIDYLRLKFWV